MKRVGVAFAAVALAAYLGLVALLGSASAQAMPCPQCNGTGSVEYGHDRCCQRECSRCKGSGTVSIECAATFDVGHLAGVIRPVTSGSAAEQTILYLVEAFVRDDGESGSREPADIGLKVLGDLRYDEELCSVRLYGPVDNGIDDDGTRKLEWRDWCAVHYTGFGIARLDTYKWTKVRIRAVEGDHERGTPGLIRHVVDLFAPSALEDDLVYDAYVDVENMPWNQVVRVEGDCDIPGRCATLWLMKSPGASWGIDPPAQSPPSATPSSSSSSSAKCPQCNGTGTIEYGHDHCCQKACPRCRGSGKS